MDTGMERIGRLRKELYEIDDTWGFVEREAYIDAYLQKEGMTGEQAGRYVSCLEGMLERLSVPIREGELILGGMVQGVLTYPMEMVPGDGLSHVGNPFTVDGRCAGHCCPDYPFLLQHGLKGMVREISQNAKEGSRFAEYAQRCVKAIRRYTGRYSDHAYRLAGQCREEGRRRELENAGAALAKVPYEAAQSFQEALQSVWMVHMILSCIVGGRDFGFGRMDEYLAPYYESERKKGTISREKALELLMHFMLKCNEIGGKIPVQMNYKEQPDYKPVPCSSTKQYLILGGSKETGEAFCNELSFLILEAAIRVRLIEPTLVVRMNQKHSREWKDSVSRASQTLQGQISVFNDDVIVPRLMELGVDGKKAVSYVMTGCNGVTFPGCQHTEIYHNAPYWLTKLLGLTEERECAPTTFEELTERLRREAYLAFRDTPPARRVRPEQEERFHLESIFFKECRKNAADIENGGQDQEYTVHFVAGTATMIDSLYTLNRIVYQEGRFSPEAFVQILKENYTGYEELLQEIRSYPKFGNDEPEVRPFTQLWGRLITEELERVNAQTDRLHSGGFYALYWQYKYGKILPATPDGRLAGEPISENMSPSYGSEQKGLTALLTELSQMSLDKCTTGGLNLKFVKRMEPRLCSRLFDTFFSMKGIHYAVFLVDQEALIDAKRHPERHQDLCVRITGYSEFFTKLPEYVQDEIIRRTQIEGA